MLEKLSLIIIIIVNTIAAATVVSRNFKNKVNILYGLICLMVIVWSSSNFLSNIVYDASLRLIITRFSFTSGFLMLLVVWSFSQNFPEVRSTKNVQNKLIYLTAPFFFYISLFTTFVAKDTDYQEASNLTNVITGKGYYAYIFMLLLVFYFIIYNFNKSYRLADKEKKHQIKYIGYGMMLAFVWAFLTSVIVPAFTNNWEMSKYGTLGSLYIIIPTAFAIIRYRLFDIRLAIARSLGYVLSVSALGLIYGFITFNFISEILFGSSVLTVWQRTIYTLLAVLVAFTFQPLKKFFDRWTSKLFYQDAYDGQELIDELNRCLVSTINLQKLLTDSSAIISKYIKPEYCTFGLRETEQQRKRLLGAPQIKFSNEDFVFASEILPSIPQKIIIADTLDDSLIELQKRMRKNDVAVFARLTNEVHERGVGAIVLGPKKSGNAYNSQDVKVLEIVANTMVIAIQNAIRFEEIQKFNVTLEKKVIDATAKLKRANEKLILLDNTKDDFISIASHQLRTPLTSIKGYASMMIEGDGGVPLNKTEKKFMRQILFSSQQMVGLIGDLLNLSRLNSGKFSLQLGESHLPEMIYNQIDQLRTIADEKKIKFVVDVDRKLPKLIVDENKIQQVVMNMIDNAIYYTPENGEIKVSLQKNGKKIEFKVDDSGIGVPKDEQAKLFTRYFRAGNAKKFRPNGTGIGLYMAKKVIIEHKGAIIFKSRENRGSTFGFSLPL